MKLEQCSFFFVLLMNNELTEGDENLISAKSRISVHTRNSKLKMEQMGLVLMSTVDTVPKNY